MKDLAIGRHLSYIKIKNHPILKDVDLDLVNHVTNKPYDIIAFVGENGCGKTTMLSELFNYDDSKFIVEKENMDVPHRALYLRQGSIHSNALKEVRKLIDGKDMFPNTSGRDPMFDGRLWDDIRMLKPIKELGDEQVLDFISNNNLDDISCSGEVSKLIDGKERGYNITSFSSGQQEILLKLKDIRNLSYDDYILLDEPETSLHPRWQKQIINLIREMIDDEHGEIPQIFLATHSEKVLESLIARDDALIVRLSKENGEIKTETINEMDLRLPTPTFAELDYVVFHIPSMDYHDLLLTRFGDLYNAEAIAHIDNALQRHPLYNKAEYAKIWSVKTAHGLANYKTLPVYIKNYFHHPKQGKEPSTEEIVKSIEFLRTIIKHKLEE